MLNTRNANNGKVYAKLADLRKFEKNPRTRNDEDFLALKRKIVRLGIFKDFFITSDGIILGGNQRYDATTDLNTNTFSYLDGKGTAQMVDLRGKFDEVPVTIVSFEVWEGKYKAVLNGVAQNTLFDSPEQAMVEYNIADNDPTGTTDKKLLGELIKPYIKLIPMSNYKVEIAPAVSLGTVADSVNAQSEDENKANEDDAPAVSLEPAKSEAGQIYQLGRHRLLCGDATDTQNIEKLLQGEKADMVFTDPPYLMAFEGNVHADGSKSFNAEHGAIKNDSMSKEDGEKFLFNILTTIRTFNKGAFYICFYRLGLHNLFKAFDQQKMDYKALIIWHKGNHTLSNSDYMSKYEPIVYGWVDEHKFRRKPEFDIWEIERTQKNELHPTMKPVALCSRAIINSSDTNAKVLDLFGGSGSTLIACEQTDRVCYMVELDPKYCDVIRKRYAKYVGQPDQWEELTPKIVDQPTQPVSEPTQNPTPPAA